MANHHHTTTTSPSNNNNKNNNNNNNQDNEDEDDELVYWKDSRQSLPVLSDTLQDTLVTSPNKPLLVSSSSCLFHMVTSMDLCSSGRYLVAGFADATVRLFDLNAAAAGSNNEPAVFQISYHKQSSFHTALTTIVKVSEDNRYVFCGCVRGTSELMALNLSRLYTSNNNNKNNQWDDIQIGRHTDPKLRGFGACTKCQHSNSYLLLTGKAIKNIHIWKFTPSNNNNHQWQCLYDTATNGTTIQWLAFTRLNHHGSNDNSNNNNTTSSLTAISKSDGQKLRLWDISREDAPPSVSQTTTQRPSRPPFADVAHSQSALCHANGLLVCGSDHWNQQLRLVHFTNSHTHFSELELPGAKRSRRRGGANPSWQSVTHALAVPCTSTVLLQLSDHSTYTYDWTSHRFTPLLLQQQPVSTTTTPIMTVARIGRQGWVVAAYQTEGGICVVNVNDKNETCGGWFWGYLPADLQPPKSNNASHPAHAHASLPRSSPMDNNNKRKKKKKKKRNSGTDAAATQPKREKLRLRLSVSASRPPTELPPARLDHATATTTATTTSSSKPPPPSTKKTKRSSLPIVTTAKKPRHAPPTTPARVSLEPPYTTTTTTPAKKTPLQSPIVRRHNIDPDPSVILQHCHDKLRAIQELLKVDVVCGGGRYSLRHQAEQKYLRRRVLEATRSVLLSIRDAPYPSSVDKARQFLEQEIVTFYRQQVVLLINRQSLELGAAGTAMDVTFDDPVLTVARSLMEF